MFACISKGDIKLRYAPPLLLCFAFPPFNCFLFFFSFGYGFVSSRFAPFVSGFLSCGWLLWFSLCRFGSVRCVSVFQAVSPASRVFVGCAPGLDSATRSVFPLAVVFRASSFGSGAASFARRSVAVVQAVAGVSGAVWVSFPGVSCPAGLLPSSAPGSCFCGLGSGSWASLALAVGLGVRCFVFLPSGVVPPSGWGFVSLGGGWYQA